MAQKKLQIFLSYAVEDQLIVDDLERTLSRAFGDKIRMTLMRDFHPGSEWRSTIDRSLEEADILVAVTSNRLKPGHSYTGYEIGWFTSSKRQHTPMRNFPGEERRLIPFIVLDRAVNTISEYQGVELFPNTPHKIHFNASDFKSELENLSASANSGPVYRIYKFIDEIESILNRIGRSNEQEDEPSPEHRERRVEFLRDLSLYLCKSILKNIASREKDSILPRSKLTIRIDDFEGNDDDYMGKALITLQGRRSEAFGPRAVGQAMDWNTFVKAADDATARAWRENFNSVIRQSIDEDALDHGTIVSIDKKKIFRIFVSKITTFIGGAREFDLFAIEILRPTIVANGRTTMLLEALQVAWSFRGLLLEEESDFSPHAFELTHLFDLQTMTSQMVVRLDWIMRMAQISGLQDAKSTRPIFGIQQAHLVNRFQADWDSAKARFDLASQKILTYNKSEITQAIKDNFVREVQAFCNGTRNINEAYIEKLMAALQIDPSLPNKSDAPLLTSATAAKRVTSGKSGVISLQGSHTSKNTAGPSRDHFGRTRESG